ncbi:MAG: AAA family ATPase [Leadbetterella sp.]|nr:AAA family ATPase [Leadbetterella sp.]
MAHLNYFGIENFRVFKNKKNFDLKPISVLVGTNSGGKSSLIKAIEFLKNDFSNNFANKETSFDDIEISKGLELGGFNNIKNNYNFESENISFSYPFYFPGTIESFLISISYKKSNRSKNGLAIFEVKIFKKENPEKPFVLKNHSDKKLKIDFSQLHNILVDNYGEIKNFHEESEKYFFRVKEKYDYNKEEWIDTYFHHGKEIEPIPKMKERYSGLQRLGPHKILTPDGEIEVIDDLSYSRYSVDFSSFKSFLMGYKELKTPDFLKNDDLENSKRKLNKSLLPFFIYFDDDKLRNLIPEENFVDTLIRVKRYKRELQEKFENNWRDCILKIQLDELSGNNYFPFSIDNEKKKEFISWTILEPIFLFQNYQESKESTLKNMYLENDFLKSYFITEFFVNEFIYNGINTGINALFETYSQLEFIPSNRSNTKRILLDPKERTFFDKCIEKINKSGLSNEALIFLKKNLQAFGIADNIIIEIDENTSLTTVKLSIGDNNIFLADIGYGISQLLPILLNIAINITSNEPDYLIRWYYKSSIIVIEEPETNLHPALQSKLADLFIECYEKYDIQFIIETHSEYLIRKLQYLVAKNDFKAEDTVIYNFRKATEDNPEIVKRIDINEDGGLSTDFYPGFFDEALNWELELLKLKRGKSSLN